MMEFAAMLCSNAHYEQSEITARQQAVLQRRERVRWSAAERRNKLEDCRKLMVFVQNCMEVSTPVELYTTIHIHHRNVNCWPMQGAV